MKDKEFRVWDNFTKKWLEPHDEFWINQSGSEVIDTSRYGDEWSTYVVGEDVIIVWFTGLKDKNGKEIYESDLLEIHDENFKNDESMPLAVEFRAGAFVDSYYGWHLNYKTYKIEVVGNIYENKDLLKKE